MFPLFVSANDEEVGFGLSMATPIYKDDGDTYGVSNFLGTKASIIRFLGGGIEAGMMLSLWNNFLQSLLRFVVVRSNNNESIRRIILP